MTDKTVTPPLKAQKASSLKPKGSADLQGKITKLEQSLDEKSKEITELKDDKIRTLAEMQNIQSRHHTKLQEAHQYSLRKFIEDLLPILDSLDTGIDTWSAHNDGQSNDTMEGMKVTRDLFLSTIKRYDVEVINPNAGDDFNPQWHEAISMQSSDTIENNKIITVAQKGYQIKDRLVRAAKVVVCQTE
ncbi:MAG TPA: nucleotide exchange factor GrpE [Gammaproteobacteria bacterium]|nr:nucleotide exchange factor GrpE [Gammaproteobacteria bacterium]